MRRLHTVTLTFIALAGVAALAAAAPAPTPAPYVPAAVYCYQPQIQGPASVSPLCPTLPGDIGPDQKLTLKGFGYKGISNVPDPATPADDVETPFDNLSWQTFVALNWTAGKQNRPAAEGLQGTGPRVWQTYDRVSQVFGNSIMQANCRPLLGEQVFSIGSNGDGTAAVRNEEYIQAATGDPAIDVNGNWTIYERRLNGIEIAYLRSPGGHAEWNLTTPDGQKAFLAVAGNTANFPAKGDAGAANGAIEVKAAWRILDPVRHAANAKRFYIVRAVLAVSPDLVTSVPGKPRMPICAHVELGLVAMHIIQKNPKTTNALEPEWFWTTFEQVDNAPLATNACDLRKPGPPDCKEVPNQLQCPVAVPAGAPDYSYFNARAQDLPTNQPPAKQLGAGAFLWNPVPPYARLYLATARNGLKAGTQISRCWQIYKLTQQLNAQWQQKLRAIGSVFANYMLIGTQWGAAVEAAHPPTFPPGAVPGFLSNSVLETYLQTYFPPGDGFNTGSCISCHGGATFTGSSVSTNLSFLPGLITPTGTRRPPIPPHHL
jgi:hypothetical protein